MKLKRSLTDPVGVRIIDMQLGAVYKHPDALALFMRIEVNGGRHVLNLQTGHAFSPANPSFLEGWVRCDNAILIEEGTND